MPQSISIVYIHLVFTTLNREPFLRETALREKLHAYLAGVSNEHGCPAIKVGGVADHVHILARLGREITQSDLARELKRASSLWLKTQSPALAEFKWQPGFGVFSVSYDRVDTVSNYIKNQSVHHAQKTFREEFDNFAELHGVKLEERFYDA